MFLLRDKMIMQGEKRETSTQPCNETMLTRQVEGFCILYLAALINSIHVFFTVIVS